MSKNPPSWKARPVRLDPALEARVRAQMGDATYQNEVRALVSEGLAARGGR